MLIHPSQQLKELLYCSNTKTVTVLVSPNFGVILVLNNRTLLPIVVVSERLPYLTRHRVYL